MRVVWSDVCFWHKADITIAVMNPEDLAKITDFTLSHYNEHAEDFWEGTRDHNVNQNITALLQNIEGEPPYTILDFGCGPGRDLKVFAELGH